MDSRPSRSSQQTDRRVISNAEPAYRQPEPQRQYADEPASQPVQPRSRQQSVKPSSPKNWILLAIGAVIIAALVVGAFLFWPKGGSSSVASTIDGSKYQAVFFTNGQVYFGKLEMVNDDYLKLTDIFYLQTEGGTGTDSENPQSADPNANVQLIKLGEEVHGPEDAMTIARDQMLFFENLKTDGKVAQTIAQYKQNNQ